MPFPPPWPSSGPTPQPAAMGAPRPSRGSHGFKRTAPVVCGMVTTLVCLMCPRDQIRSRNLRGLRLWVCFFFLLQPIVWWFWLTPYHSPSSRSWIREGPVRLHHSKAALPPFRNNKHYCVGKDFDTTKYPHSSYSLFISTRTRGFLLYSILLFYLFWCFNLLQIGP